MRTKIIVRFRQITKIAGSVSKSMLIRDFLDQPTMRISMLENKLESLQSPA